VVGLLSAYAGGQKILIATTTQHINDKKKQLQEIPGLIDAITADEHLAALVAVRPPGVFNEIFPGLPGREPEGDSGGFA
jgi:hypothetical protein